jgi:toxin ParE1/3/4
MKLVIAPAALSELEDAAAFYKRKAGAELGLAFVSEFERAARLLQHNPLLATEFRLAYRRYIFRRFPYSVIYQAIAEELRILAVAHHRRRPGYWIK